MTLTTLAAIRLLAEHGASIDQQIAVLLSAKTSSPQPGMIKVFRGTAADALKFLVKS